MRRGQGVYKARENSVKDRVKLPLTLEVVETTQSLNSKTVCDTLSHLNLVVKVSERDHLVDQTELLEGGNGERSGLKGLKRVCRPKFDNSLPGNTGKQTCPSQRTLSQKRWPNREEAGRARK